MRLEFVLTSLVHEGINTKSKKKLSVGKKIIIVLAAVVLTLGAVVGVAYWKYVYPTGKVMPGLYTIRTHNNGLPMGNFFLMQAGEDYIAIDAGGNNTETESGLQKLGISADDIVAVFITHAHWDHIGSLDLFDKAVIYTGNTEGSTFPNMPHQVISNNGIIEVSGVSIQCLYTPGHTIDSVCYLIDGKYLFVGDLFVTTNDSPFEKRYDKGVQLEYREKMLAIESVEYVFTGHFGFFKDVSFFRWWF